MRNFRVLADDVALWRDQRRPSQREIDRLAIKATERGWNGTTLDLYDGEHYVCVLLPTEDALDGRSLAEYDEAHA